MKTDGMTYKVINANERVEAKDNWEIELFEEKFGRVEFTPTGVSIESLVVEKVKEKLREAKET